METPLLFEAALDFTLCLRALCFRSCIPPPTANLWEAVLLGRPLKPSLSLNQSQGCDQKNRREVTWLISHKKFSRPFLLQLHIRRGGEGRFYDSLHFTNETSLHSFIQSASQQTHINHFFIHDWVLQIQETNLILTFKIVHSWTVFFIVSWKTKSWDFLLKMQSKCRQMSKW